MNSSVSSPREFLKYIMVNFGINFFITVVYLLDALRIDDPVGCFAVHWGAGLWGVIAAAFFSHGLPPSHNGIFRGGTGEVLGWNILCALTVTVWSFGVSAIVVCLFYVR